MDHIKGYCKAKPRLGVVHKLTENKTFKIKNVFPKVTGLLGVPDLLFQKSTAYTFFKVIDYLDRNHSKLNTLKKIPED